MENQPPVARVRLRPDAVRSVSLVEASPAGDDAVGRVADLVIARWLMSRTILLVDDNDLYRGMLRSLLELHGFQMVPARNGAEGLACAATESIDAAVVDVDMPDMDGFEFCRRLRAQQQAAGRDVPIWIITGTFRPALARHAAEAGAILALRKPFPIGELRAHLEQEFQKRDAQPDAGDSSAAEAPGA